MLRLVTVLCLLFTCFAAIAQDDVLDIKVSKQYAVDITPYMPYLLHAQRYSFGITGTRPHDDIRVSVTQGKAIVVDTNLYLTPRYTGSDKYMQPDTITVTVMVRDQRSDLRTCVKKYLVYSPSNKPKGVTIYPSKYPRSAGNI